MSIIKTLKHFTQAEVDKAPGEILTKDLPYGGNRPYVIGTLLRDSANGEYITYKKWNEGAKHRVCIEHEPDELVAWKVVPAGTSSLEIPLTELGDSGLGEVKRVGFVQLKDEEIVASMMATVISAEPDVSENINNSPRLHFFKVREACEMDSSWGTANGNFYEVDPYVFKPLYLTHSVLITDCHLQHNDAVFYCVYKKHSGLLESEIQMMTHTDYGEIGFYNIRIPARRCRIQYIVASLINLSIYPVDHVQLIGEQRTVGGASVKNLFTINGNNGYTAAQLGNTTVDPYWVNSEGGTNSLDYCHDVRGYVTMNDTLRPRGKVLLQIKHYPEG